MSDDECGQVVMTYDVEVTTEDHCCERMAFFLRADDLPVSYYSKTREWGIIYPGDGSFQEIYFCPWCGQRLPTSLREEWYERVRARGIDPGDPEAAIPESMCSSQWWKNEGL